MFWQISDSDTGEPLALIEDTIEEPTLDPFTALQRYAAADGPAVTWPATEQDHPYVFVDGETTTIGDTLGRRESVRNVCVLPAAWDPVEPHGAVLSSGMRAFLGQSGWALYDRETGVYWADGYDTQFAAVVAGWTAFGLSDGRPPLIVGGDREASLDELRRRAALHVERLALDPEEAARLEQQFFTLRQEIADAIVAGYDYARAEAAAERETAGEPDYPVAERPVRDLESDEQPIIGVYVETGEDTVIYEDRNGKVRHAPGDCVRVEPLAEQQAVALAEGRDLWTEVVHDDVEREGGALLVPLPSGLLQNELVLDREVGEPRLLLDCLKALVEDVEARQDGYAIGPQGSDEAIERVLRSAVLLYTVGAGTLGQCLDTAIVWERG